MGHDRKPSPQTRVPLRTAQTVNALAEDSMWSGDYLAPRPSHTPTTPESKARLAKQVAGAKGSFRDRDLPPGWKRVKGAP